VRIAAAAVLLVVGGMLPATAPVSAADLVTVPMPGPGHSAPWSTTVQNPASATSTVYLSVVDVSGAAAQLDDELRVSVSIDGATVIPSTPLRRMLGDTPVSIGTVAGGGAKTVSGEVSLSAAAGDAYQGLSADVTLRLSSVEPQSPPPPLADTGLSVIGAGLPLALVALGAVLRLRRRKPSEQQ
jgi:hypothetical protein